MDRYEARKQIVKDLEELGLLLKVEDHTHNVGTCYRCATVIEPLISKQWFVKMKPLAEPAIEVVKTEQSNLYRKDSQRYTLTGWKTFRIGVFQGSFGGDTEYRLITVRNAAI